MRRLASSISLIFFVLLCPDVPMAADEHVFDTFTLYYENDFLEGTDRDYTSGLKLTWSTPYTSDVASAGWPSWFYPLMARLPFVNRPERERAISFSFGQEIYTPEDIDTTEPITDDRPYAGRTYFAAGFHSKTERRRNTWELNVGILGPASMAEQAQGLIHKINGASDPQGWDNQLENEVTLDAIFETQWKLRRPGFRKGFAYDFIPHLGVRLGTVNVYINGGGEFRFGWDMPDDFGSCPIRAGCDNNSAFEKKNSDFNRQKRLGVHFFIAADGRFIARDIYLDGNTFRDSHSVDKKTQVADFIGGASVRYGTVKTTYSYIRRTRQFDTQDDGQTFSSLSISWLY